MGGITLRRFHRKYNAGDIIFEEGSLGDAIFLVDEGTIQVLKDSDGLERVITTLGSGAIVGEMGLLDERHHRTATVKAETTVEGWKLPREEFLSIIDSNEKFRKKLINALINRLNKTTSQLAENLKHETILPKFAFLLLSTLDAEELEDEETRTFPLDHSVEYLAYRFGASPDVMNDFLALAPKFSLAKKDSETREKLFSVAQRIVDQSLEESRFEAEPDRDASPELIETTRRAREHLDDLTDEGETLTDDDVRSIMEERKDLRTVLEDHKESGREDFIVELLETILNSIDREIKQRRNS